MLNNDIRERRNLRFWRNFFLLLEKNFAPVSVETERGKRAQFFSALAELKLLCHLELSLSFSEWENKLYWVSLFLAFSKPTTLSHLCLPYKQSMASMSPRAGLSIFKPNNWLEPVSPSLFLYYSIIFGRFVLMSFPLNRPLSAFRFTILAAFLLIHPFIHSLSRPHECQPPFIRWLSPVWRNLSLR